MKQFIGRFDDINQRETVVDRVKIQQNLARWWGKQGSNATDDQNRPSFGIALAFSRYHVTRVRSSARRQENPWQEHGTWPCNKNPRVAGRVGSRKRNELDRTLSLMTIRRANKSPSVSRITRNVFAPQPQRIRRELNHWDSHAILFTLKLVQQPSRRKSKQFAWWGEPWVPSLINTPQILP